MVRNICYNLYLASFIKRPEVKHQKSNSQKFLEKLKLRENSVLKNILNFKQSKAKK